MSFCTANAPTSRTAVPIIVERIYRVWISLAFCFYEVPVPIESPHLCMTAPGIIVWSPVTATTALFLLLEQLHQALCFCR